MSGHFILYLVYNYLSDHEVKFSLCSRQLVNNSDCVWYSSTYECVCTVINV